jgi:DeoR/GlpR family transcriptional regulator of sugar metabolism
MIAGARRRILLADSSKYGQAGVIRLCGWEDIDLLITDAGLGEKAREALLIRGIEVQAARLPGQAA